MFKINQTKYAIFLYKNRNRSKGDFRFPKFRYFLSLLFGKIASFIASVPKSLLNLLKFVFAVIVIGFLFFALYPLISGSVFEDFIMDPTLANLTFEISVNPWNLGWLLIYFFLIGFVFVLGFWLLPKFMEEVMSWGLGNNDLSIDELEKIEQMELEIEKNAKMTDFF
ncbi:MAG: hypothetical protein ACTSQN_07325 [Candidatus Heimdallarchaeota archaeon]